MPADRPTIGSLLLLWRVARGISQREMAARLGMTAATYCRFENGKSLDMKHTLRVLLWLADEESEGAG